METTRRYIRLEQEFVLDGEPQYFFHEGYEDEIDDDMTMGEMFRNLQSWHGRCQSSVYIDTKGGTKRVGWYFIKACDDGHGCIGTWATVLERTVDVEYLNVA